MKALLVHNFYQQWGGEDQVFLDEGAMLRDGGHEVVTYTRHNDDIHTASRLSVARDTFWSHRSYREVRSLIRRERPDIVHCTNLFPLISPAVYDAARAEGVPVVQSLHNYRLLCPNAFFVRDGKTCEDCLTRLFAWPGVRHKCYRDSTSASAVLAGMTAWHRMIGTWRHKVDCFIALSEFSRRKFSEGGLPTERIVVKANSMDRDPPIGNGAGGYAVFVARLSPEKGVDVLLQAWERLSTHVPLKIVGVGALEHLAREAAARHPHIEWLGRQTPEQVLDIVGNASFQVIPSVNYEHCPKVLIEANAKGTPAIASSIGALAEMIEPGRNGFLVPAGDAKALAAKVDDLFAMPDLVARLRASARQVYDRRWTSRRNYERILEIYSQVLGREIPLSGDLTSHSSPQTTPELNAAEPSLSGATSN